METIIVSWQNGNVFQWNGNYRCISVSPQNFTETNIQRFLIEDTIAMPLQNSFQCVLQSVSPETYRNPFLSFRCKWTISVPFRKCFIASGPFQYRFESVVNTDAKLLLHKRRVETFLSVSAGFSLQLCFRQKSCNGCFNLLATIMQRLIWRSSLIHQC
jgi:hypothetical protein